MPTDGPAPSVHEDREAALRRILEREDVSELTVVSASQLSAEMRLLHNIVTRVFFPKTGRFDFISERDLVMLHAIVDGYILNLPKMMMAFIGETMTRSRASLPYGMIFTLIFREFRVPIPEGETVIRLRHTDFYDRRSLERMGCAKVDGRWVRTSREQRPAPEAEPTDREEAIPGSPAPASSPAPAHASSPTPAPAAASSPAHCDTFSLDEERIGALADLIVDRVEARVRSEVETLRGELQALSERLSADIRSCMDHILTRMDERGSRPVAQDSSASSQHDPAPAPVHAPAPDPTPVPVQSAEHTLTLDLSTALPPRPPRPMSIRSGPASRTRSRAPSWTSRESPPSITQSRSHRVHSRSQRSGHPGPDPIDIPSDQD